MSTVKKILNVNSYFITNRLHGELIKKLDEIGFKQTVFIPVEKNHQIGLNSIESLCNSKLYYKKCFNSITRFLWPVKMLQIWQGFNKLAKNLERPDIIHAHSLFVNGLIAWKFSKKTGIPFIVTVRNTDINIFLKKSVVFRRLGERILNEASVIMFLSTAYRDIQLRNYLSPEVFESILSKTVTIPNGINDFWIDNRLQESRKLNNDKVKVLFSGKLRENKNLQGLISACEIVVKNGYNISLEVVGDGPLLKELKAKKYPLEVIFYGFISDKQKLLEIYRNCDIMAVPSFRESFGLIYAEGMSQGLPALYSKGQGFDGIFLDGYIGYAVDSYNIDDIAEKIETCIKTYSILSENCVNEVTQFSWNNVINKLSTLYNQSY